MVETRICLDDHSRIPVYWNNGATAISRAGIGHHWTQGVHYLGRSSINHRCRFQTVTLSQQSSSAIPRCGPNAAGTTGKKYWSASFGLSVRTIVVTNWCQRPVLDGHHEFHCGTSGSRYHHVRSVLSRSGDVHEICWKRRGQCKKRPGACNGGCGPHASDGIRGCEPACGRWRNALHAGDQLGRAQA
jgi:hypothetical protein